MSDDIAPVKRRRNRLYVPLDVEFATDPKILDAGPLAAYPALRPPPGFGEGGGVPLAPSPSRRSPRGVRRP